MTRLLRLTSLTLALAFSLAAPAVAQHALGGEGPYDPAVPTPSSVLGYELGSAMTPHHRLVEYASRVAETSERVRLDTVATTWEGRPVLLATVSSAANQARLEAIRAGAHRLADPRGASEQELARLVAEQPVVVWLGYTVHGDEASGAEAALGTLYQLAAGRDAETRAILDSTVVLIDPVQNPDGHDRHVMQVAWDLGRFGPDPHPRAIVHDHDWHGARTNHYLFDMNRDWLVHTQPETRGRMAVYRDWFPHVAADLHEMGSSSTYFFAPPMQPVNPNIHPLIREGWTLFSQGNARAFDEHGWGFFTREGYDEFYPGYGPSWPLYTGAIGMTYEQGSSEGGAIRRDDGSILTLREAARHHYAASLATLRTAATHRSRRVADYLDFRLDAIESGGDEGLRTVILAPGAQDRTDSLVAVLLRHGIEVGRLTRDAGVRATEYGVAEGGRVNLPAGAYVVDLAQPQGVLARTLLEPDPAFDPAFIREELERREAGQRDRFYDMTGWALPFLYRVQAWHSPETVGPVEPVTPLDRGGALAGGPSAPGPAGEAGSDGNGAAPPVAPPGPAGFAYAFAPGSQASLRLLADLLADGIRVRHARASFRVGGVDFPHGAFLVLTHRNRDRPDLHARLVEGAAETGARVVAVQTALAEEGTDLGSRSVAAIPTPKVALVAGDAVSSYSYGTSWYTFDQLLGFPVTRLDLEDLPRALDDFNVVVMPSSYGIGSTLEGRGTDALREWIHGGGTLITLDAATDWLASENGLSRLERRDEASAEGDVVTPPASIPGAILRARADTLSPLMAGVDDVELPVMLFGSRLYQAPEDARAGEVVLRYVDDPARLRLAGYLWPEAPARVAGAPYLWTESLGDGRIIAFTGDPNFRAMWRGLLPVFANAVFLGGSF